MKVNIEVNIKTPAYYKFAGAAYLITEEGVTIVEKSKHETSIKFIPTTSVLFSYNVGVAVRTDNAMTEDQYNLAYDEANQFLNPKQVYTIEKILGEGAESETEL